MNMKACPHCGEELPQEADFCPYCMEKLIEERNAPTVAEKPAKAKFVLIIAICVFAAAAIIAISPLTRNNSKASQNDITNDEITVAAWIMKLRPHGATGSFRFCLENSVVGFGWGLEGAPSTIKEYRTMRAQEGAYPGDTTLNDTLDSFENMTTPGSSYTHLVWTTGPDGEYYICEITGGYQYSREEGHDEAGIVNFAKCRFYKVGSDDLVPQYIIDEMEGSGVIRFVHNMKAIETTKQLWLVARGLDKN